MFLEIFWYQLNNIMSMTKEKVIDIVYKVIRFAVLLIGGFIVTILSLKIPFDGPEILDVINCGTPSGLPFSFVGTWKYLSRGPYPACVSGFDLVAFTLDIIFWVAVFYLTLLLLEKLAEHFHITLKKDRVIAALIIFVLLLFLFYLQSVGAQSIIKFDLENLRNQDINLTKSYDIIKIQEAWKAVISSTVSISPIIVGIVDTGVDVQHQEFHSPSIRLGRFALIDFDPNGHGTKVTGVIGANNVSATTSLSIDSPQMNGILSGVLEESEYKLEVRPGVGVSTLLSFTANLESAINSGSRVINMSFGMSPCGALSITSKNRLLNKCYTTTQEFLNDFDVYVELFQQAKDDVLFVSAAGNDDIDASLHLPGALSNLLGNVITVGATSLNDDRADFGFLLGASNFGSVVDISAPGVGVYAPKSGGGYDTNFNGTSASAPLVTGVAAILKALEPEYQKYNPGLIMTPAKIKEVLTKSADPIKTDKPLGSDCFDPNNNPQGYNGCRLNAHRAVSWLLPPIPVILNPPIVLPAP